MLIVDAHEDLAYNIHEFGRDYTRSAAATRQAEQGTTTPGRNGDTLLGWPDYVRGRVAVVFATLFAAPQRLRLHPWETLIYATAEEAHRLYRQQLDSYHRLVDDHPDRFTLLQSQAELSDHLARWRQFDQPPAEPEPETDPAAPPAPAEERAEAERLAQELQPPVGLVMLMEGAEGVRSPGELDLWHHWGVRLVGPAWGGTRFCGGTREPGPLTREGYALLEGLAALNFGLDLSHMDEAALLQTLDVYPGQVLASHSNALRLVKGAETNRHLSDRAIQGIIARDGVIGVVPFNRFLVHGWSGPLGRQSVSLDQVAAHIDYICQMAGDALHVGIGSDFDGGFGLQSVPADIDTVADLQKLAPLLAQRGYGEPEIAAILSENWLRVLYHIL